MNLPHDDDIERVHYDLSSWSIDAQSTLVEQLAERGIEHSWEGLELVVAADVEGVVDALVEHVESHTNEERNVVSTGEVEYDLVSWTEDDRTRVSLRLADEFVRFRWEGSVLVVSDEFEKIADRIIDVDLLESD